MRSVLLLVSLALALGCSGLPQVTITLPPDPNAATPTPERPATGSTAAVASPSTGTSSSGTSSKKSSGTSKSSTTKSSSRKSGSGEIQVTTMAAVIVNIDGVPATFDPTEGYLYRDLPAGQHQLEVVNALGKTVATETVDVPAGQRVRYRYKAGGVLEGQGTVPVIEEAPAPAVQTVYEEAPAAPEVGSVQIAGLSADSSSVWIGGIAVPWSNPSGYVYTGLQPGNYNLRVEGDGYVIYDGDVEVRANQNHRCVAAWQDASGAYALDCHWTQSL